VIRLALLFEFPTLLGGERSMLALAGGIREAGFDPVAVAPGEGALAGACARQGIPVEPLPHLPARPPAERRAELGRALDRVRPQLVHAASLAVSRLAGPLVEGRLPSLAHLRDIVRLSAAAVRDVNRHARILAVSRATKRWHVEQGIREDRTFVLRNGVDLGVFRPRPPTGALQRELGLPPGAPLVVAVGQVGPRKGTDLFLAAARRIASGHPRAAFAVVGERHSTKDEAVRFEEDLRSVAAEPPLGGRVRFLGYRGDVPSILNDAAVLVHAARQEPLGRVLLEAAASGTPVVATEVGGTREIFPDARAARLVPPGDPEAVAREVLTLLESPGARAALFRAARARAEEAFDARVVARELAGHYRAVLRSAAVPPGERMR